MLYKTDELLLIENLTYFTDEFPFTGILSAKGKTVREFLNTVDMNKIDLEHDYASYMTGRDFINLILAIRHHDNILDAKIIDTHYDKAYGGGGGVSAVLISEKTNEAVIAFRGTAANEWTDDFIASNQVDSLQQINALEWYKKMVSDHELLKYTITVTGHSKGGNKAKYITILDDTVTRCVSFDGQGFSDIFMDSYKDRIILRQQVIENHNVDFDYVNIILNDIGRKTYYIGYDYGKGGFAEAHCPNTFFDFRENGEYQMHINPQGQRPEMQILDQFINSLSRSDASDKERTETAKLIGILVEKAFAIGTDEKNTALDYLNFLCDLIRDETYSNNTAYVLAFIIKYSQENPLFLQALKDIMSHFGMKDISGTIDTVREIIESKKINRIVNLSSFLVLHVNHITKSTVKSIVRKKTGLELSDQQVEGLLTIIAMTKETLDKLTINMDGADIEFSEEDMDDEEIEMNNLNVVVLAGGLSVQRNISLESGFEIKNALEEMGHKVILLDAFMGYGIKEEMIQNPFEEPEKYSLKPQSESLELADLWAVKKRREDKSPCYFGPNVLQICKAADITFIALQGASAENGKLQAAFDLLGITYTGVNYFSSALSTSKTVSKQLMENAGIPVARGFSIRKGANVFDPEKVGLTYPLVVKPANGDIGLGISYVSSFSAYKKALKDAFIYDREILVEEYIRGREFSVSTIDGHALPVIEVLPLNTTDIETDDDLLGRSVKKCPADIDAYLTMKLQKDAITATKILGIRTISKTDFIVKEDGSYICLECDSLPLMSKDSQFFLEAKADGYTYPQFCNKILMMGINKKG